MAEILMCPPDYYGIEYEINPWMSRSRQADHATAIEQWNSLKQTFEQLGAIVHTMTPVKGLPDLVFTANAGVVFEKQVVLARFRHAERQREVEHDEAWFQEHDFETKEISAGLFFEGAGDALFCGDTLYAGYRIRSDAKAHQELGKLLNVRVIPLELVDPYYYHLDTCFCPLKDGTAIYYPNAFDTYGQKVLQELIPNLIPIENKEARRFGCNAVVIGKHVVTNTECPLLHQTLRDHGFDPHETALDEFTKAGGSAKCLTLRLDGEEAASWK